MKHWFLVFLICMATSALAAPNQPRAGRLESAILDTEEAFKRGKDGDGKALATHADAALRNAEAAAKMKADDFEVRKAITLLKLAAYHGRHRQLDVAVRQAEDALSQLHAALSGASPSLPAASGGGDHAEARAAARSEGPIRAGEQTSTAAGETAQKGGPLLHQEFLPWEGNLSSDQIWRIAGVWTGTGNNVLDPALASLMSVHNGQPGGFLSLSVKANALRGSEIQTLPSYGYGYYETRMKVTDVPGVCASFFWVEAPKYGPREWDVEFLTNEPWISSANSGKVHLFIHPANIEYIVELPFNPSHDFHRYGFLWTAQSIAFTVDGQIVHRFSDSSLNTNAKGFIMMNTWTGKADWGGGPPTSDATSYYDWVKFWPGVDSPQE
ncbi:small metal-binding protein SmbP [Methylocystis bryophila]|uniref:Beta-glucanase n=1 Tax=Methylocystis bryophila TaxID=655015 RepID=A0A1W6MUP3_9HYPH|nr:small metal-binding protein SmbP [Methylocystis bryophila]ARN81304.1 hypothetical protein B1812_09680 [Methylocystis bryophila]BDV37272.1 hypothetical protein DSM21852_05250 [Methylocystis bryophila]